MKKLISTLLAVTLFTPIGGIGQETFAEKGKETDKLSTKLVKNSSPLNQDKVTFPYKVSPGDQIEYLAKIYGTTSLEIISLNKKKKLIAEETIYIPVTPKVMDEIKRKANGNKELKGKVSSTQKKRTMSRTGYTAGGKVTKKVLKMKATAYGNEWGPHTASGKKVRFGHVAVHKSLGIPYGTIVRISGFKSNYPGLKSGEIIAQVEDTGVPSSNKIDIYIPLSEKNKLVYGFGVQNVKVEILG